MTIAQQEITNLHSAAADLHSDVPPGWYERSIAENPLQRFWHTRRFVAVRKIIEPTGGNILDIGSSDGTFTNVIGLASKANSIVGIDALEESVKWAANRWKDIPSMSFRVGDAHALQFPDNSFDAAFALEVMEHVFHPDKVISEMKRVLKPGGYAVLLVPSDNLLFRCIWAVWTRWKGKIWADTHIQSFKNRSLATLAESSGMTIEVNSTFLLGMLHLVKARKK